MQKINRKSRFKLFNRGMAFFVILTFLASTFVPTNRAYAQSLGGLGLPQLGSMLSTSPHFIPAHLSGITIYPDDPLRFDFIVDRGDDRLKEDALDKEINKLVKYFLAALTIPEDQMWVNLSPYEKDRIIPDTFATTEMGRDLLAQDYLLKQLTASLMYPEDALGDKFWKRIHSKVQQYYKNNPDACGGFDQDPDCDVKADIAINTFNKIWIVPQKADVYVKNNSVFVVNNHLKVLLEEDYVALAHHREGTKSSQSEKQILSQDKIVTGIQSEIIREVLIPEIEKEVNEGKNFAQLRQIFYSLILATWYKQNLKKSFLGKVYINQNKTDGVQIADKEFKQKIYDQYVQAFQHGVYDFIKEDYDPVTQSIVSRKYFSGGVDPSMLDSALGQTEEFPLFADRSLVVAGHRLQGLDLAGQQISFAPVVKDSETPDSAVLAEPIAKEGISSFRFGEARVLSPYNLKQIPQIPGVFGVSDDTLMRFIYDGLLVQDTPLDRIDELFQARQRIRDLIQNNPHREIVVLELGVGTAKALIELAREFQDAPVRFIGISDYFYPKQWTTAPSNITFILDKMENLLDYFTSDSSEDLMPAGSSHVDLVMSYWGVRHVKSDRILEVLRNVLGLLGGSGELITENAGLEEVSLLDADALLQETGYKMIPIQNVYDEYVEQFVPDPDGTAPYYIIHPPLVSFIEGWLIKHLGAYGSAERRELAMVLLRRGVQTWKDQFSFFLKPTANGINRFLQRLPEIKEANELRAMAKDLSKNSYDVVDRAMLTKGDIGRFQFEEEGARIFSPYDLEQTPSSSGVFRIIDNVVYGPIVDDWRVKNTSLDNIDKLFQARQRIRDLIQNNPNREIVVLELGVGNARALIQLAREFQDAPVRFIGVSDDFHPAQWQVAPSNVTFIFDKMENLLDYFTSDFSKNLMPAESPHVDLVMSYWGLVNVERDQIVGVVRQALSLLGGSGELITENTGLENVPLSDADALLQEAGYQLILEYSFLSGDSVERLVPDPDRTAPYYITPPFFGYGLENWLTQNLAVDQPVQRRKLSMDLFRKVVPIWKDRLGMYIQKSAAKTINRFLSKFPEIEEASELREIADDLLENVSGADEFFDLVPGEGEDRAMLVGKTFAEIQEELIMKMGYRQQLEPYLKQSGIYFDQGFSEESFDPDQLNVDTKQEEIVVLNGPSRMIQQPWGTKVVNPLFIRFGEYAITESSLREVIPKHLHNKVLFLEDIDAQLTAVQTGIKYALPYLAQMYQARDSFKDATVLELGAAQGIASFFALKLGAKKVVGIEAEDLQDSFDREVKQNGFQDRAVFLQGSFSDEDMPERLKAHGPFDIFIGNIGPHGIYSGSKGEGANMQALRLVQTVISQQNTSEFSYIGAGFDQTYLNGNVVGFHGPGAELTFLKEYFQLEELRSTIYLLAASRVKLSDLFGSFMAKVKVQDAAMLTPGGIDLNPQNLKLNEQGETIEFDIPTNLIHIESHSIKGFVPVMINVTPVLNFNLLLGLNTDEQNSQESQQVIQIKPLAVLERKPEILTPVEQF